MYVCVCVCVCASVCTLPGRAPSAPLPLLSILLSHWNNRGMWPLLSPTVQLTHKHTRSTLPPAAPELLMDTWACCCSALIFQLLCLSLPLFSPHSLSPSFLATQNAHLTSSKGLFSTFTETPHLPFFFPSQSSIFFSFIHRPPPPC